MNITELKNKLIADISAVNDKELLLQLKSLMEKKTTPTVIIQASLSEILELKVKGTDPIFVQLDHHNAEVKTWKQLFITVTSWILDDNNIGLLKEPIPDHYGKTKYAINNEPFHANGKPFSNQVKQGQLFLEGHRSTEEQLKTLQYIFKYFNLNSSSLKISFLGSPNPNQPLTGSI
ncbi:hypothetical protein AWW67_16215 [Roseivirga seohaensis]|uniref:Uncharacterized protein n=1 Tax=Roseivirga seohaensis TaxID=1914963 RepID=A0A150Y345_9BACT|nr:hypothetical protein [Roseivirga seohaensis]KYG85255.1 hypothetical protein AWW67_16215 [Roseivirga seohaensis]